MGPGEESGAVRGSLAPLTKQNEARWHRLPPPLHNKAPLPQAAPRLPAGVRFPQEPGTKPGELALTEDAPGWPWHQGGCWRRPRANPPGDRDRTRVPHGTADPHGAPGGPSHSPVVPLRQRQLYALFLSWQVPPFLQGWLWHSLMLMSQRWPV